VEFRILGPLEVAGADGPIRLGGPKQRATLALLLLGANRVVSVERFAEDLYSGAPPVTAVTQVQRQISELRKALGAELIETRPPGYAIVLRPGQLDLERFERLAEEAVAAAAEGDAQQASDLLRRALALWRGEPLADLASEPFAVAAIRRLEEIRLAALEQRIDADLVLGYHARLVGELEELVAEHPLREGFHGKRMLALYLSGRQAEALEAYRDAREKLVVGFGIEPTAALRDLERAILTHDPSLAPGRPAAADPVRSVLVVPSEEQSIEALLRVAEPFARRPSHELIFARLLTDADELQRAAASLDAVRASLDVAARVAAFTTADASADVIRLVTAYDVDLVLLDAASPAHVVEGSPADVAVLTGTPDLTQGDGIFVPFGGTDHDWTALELGAWLAATSRLPLRLVGTAADPERGLRDSSRLLADASLAVQQLTGIAGSPLLVEPSEDALAAAVDPASLVVAGAGRHALATTAPVLVVYRGLRPGALAPRETRTRFTWSMRS
jgi:DNA-binding SARP family transcriptional activator